MAVYKLEDLGGFSPRKCLQGMMERMDANELPIRRMVVVAEEDDGALVIFASGPTSQDIAAMTGLLAIGQMQLGVLQHAMTTVDE